MDQLDKTSRRTITLYRIVSNATEHGELGSRVQAEAFSHPREEVSKTEMTASHTLGDTSTSTGERQSSDTVWADGNVGVGIAQVQMGMEDILRSRSKPASDGSIREHFQCWDFHANLEFRVQEFFDGRVDSACSLEYNKASGLGNAKVDDLPRWWIRRIWACISRAEQPRT